MMNDNMLDDFVQMTAPSTANPFFPGISHVFKIILWQKNKYDAHECFKIQPRNGFNIDGTSRTQFEYFIPHVFYCVH
jgi:hypothetical protein